MSALSFFYPVTLCLFLAAQQQPVRPNRVVIPLVSTPKWEVASVKKIDVAQLAQFGDDLAVDAEYGVRSASKRSFRKGGLKATAIFEEAADPSSAYGLYTIYQTEDMHHAPGIPLAQVGSRFALIARGRYFIRIQQPSAEALSDRDLRSLLVMIGGTKLSETNLESLPTPLPSQGLIPDTEKYLLGPQAATRVLGSFPVNLIGFRDGVEAQVGRYRPGKFKLMEISYPTPQLARLSYTAMQRNLGLNRSQNSGATYGVQQGSFIILVLGAPTKEAADRLLSQFKVTQTITWNARYHGKGSFTYQMIRLVIANLELVFIIGGFAFLGGFLIFLAKRLILKFFPNVSWLRPDEEEVTRLRLI